MHVEIVSITVYKETITAGNAGIYLFSLYDIGPTVYINKTY